MKNILLISAGCKLDRLSLAAAIVAQGHIEDLMCSIVEKPKPPDFKVIAESLAIKSNLYIDLKPKQHEPFYLGALKRRKNKQY